MFPSMALPYLSNLFAVDKYPGVVVGVSVKDVCPVLIRLDLADPFGGFQRPRVVGAGAGQRDAIRHVQYTMDAAKRHVEGGIDTCAGCATP